ncbi:hypothetical protein [uncultured Xylophilus sp.]|uniref:hypothetical protein n=1 Tax=uncultured Xylophilus sp. TaxID=296832 RepID=UPI0025F02638|nr:hypothetical protein [uncultured Xylophilus sp.]
MSQAIHWQFFRAGGVPQVHIRTGADIARLDTLDQKLWVALACPTRGIEFDPRTLDLIDSDKDGRIRPPELLAACRWACARLRDPQTLVAGGDSLPLDALAETEEGAALAQEARRLLGLRGRPEATMVALADVLDRSALLAAMRFNGDGVITPATTDDADLRRTLQEIAATQGTVHDRNGQPGIDRIRAEAFFADARALDTWYARAGTEQPALPLGDRTLAAAEAIEAVRAKVDDYFARARLAAYDDRAGSALQASPEEYHALGRQTLSASDAVLRALPLAVPAPGRPLPLVGAVNPAWAAALRTLKERAVDPLLGAAHEALDEAGWLQLQERLATGRAWLSARPASGLDALDVDDLRRRLAAGAEAAVLALIADDEAQEPHNARLADLEKLLRLQRDLLRLLHNFVSFQDFYRREGAIFQAGTLYLDARSCDLTVRVADPAKHAVLAGLAKTCLAYCECTREGEKMHIAAAFTAGDVDFLFVGRNGVFYDRQGRDWDATIVKLIENPTSIGQAFFSPYKKFLRVLEEQVAKRAAASETAAQGSLSALAGSVATAGKSGSPAATHAAVAKLPGRVAGGTVAALGVALGSISAVLVGIFGKFVELGPWIPIAIVGIVAAISGPSMLIAWLKLRQRSLGPILDASGWAVNGRMKVNTRLGASLSKIAQVPPGATALARDPFAERKGPAWLLGLVVVVVLLAAGAWRMGWLDRALPEPLRRSVPAPVVQNSSTSSCATSAACNSPLPTSSS